MRPLARAAVAAIIVFVAGGPGARGVAAQDVSPVSPGRANAFSSEFAIPQSPAFNMMQIDGGAILRPATVKELTTNLGAFTSDGGLTLPQKVGIEFSPGLLWSGPDLSLQQYQEDAWWYRTRVSLAVQRRDSTSTATRLALGIRISLEDGADLRTNAPYIRFVEAFHLRNLRDLSQLQNDLVEGVGLEPEEAIAIATHMSTATSLTTALQQLDAVFDAQGITEDATRERVRDLLESVTVPSITDRSRLDAFRDSVANAAWNANSLDLAIGGLAAADDSTGANLRTEQWNAWLTVGRRLGANGQLLLGGAGVLARSTTDNTWDGRSVLSARIYVGSNRLKVLAESQVNLAEAHTWFVRAGAEISPSFGGWFTLSAGIKRGEGVAGSELVTDFAYNLGLEHVMNAIR